MKNTHTKELLEEILAEGEAVALEEYTRYNQRLRVKFRCKCGVETSKRFEMLNLYRLPYCEECSMLKMNEKYKKTCMERYGVANASQTSDNILKIKTHFDTKYGMHPKKTAEVQAKWTATCLEKYGGHPNQNAEVQARAEANSYHYKDYMLPQGDIVRIQGYENLALDELFQLYEQEDVVIGRGKVPTIVYYIDDVKHVYFPDMYIKSENKIIEVKSEWTLTLIKGNVEEKAQATVKAGYKYEIWVYNTRKERVETKVY